MLLGQMKWLYELGGGVCLYYGYFCTVVQYGHFGSRGSTDRQHHHGRSRRSIAFDFHDYQSTSDHSHTVPQLLLMMISELLNSLFLTYLASEYLVVQDDAGPSPSRRRLSLLTTSLQQKLTAILAGTVLVVNIVDRMVGVTKWIHVGISFLNIFSWPFKILLAASFYVGGLYLDINRKSLFARRRSPNSDSSDDDFSKRMPFWSIFLPKVGWAFCKVLPAYPFLAVTISICFMFVINLWDFLHLPEEWLNAPIYYGTLYGPFAYTYMHVKQQVLCHDAYAMPS
jgi:hypothetical protein